MQNWHNSRPKIAEILVDGETHKLIHVFFGRIPIDYYVWQILERKNYDWPPPHLKKSARKRESYKEMFANECAFLKETWNV